MEIILKELNPIKDYTEKKFELEFLSFELSEPKNTEEYAKENKLTYEAPLRTRILLQQSPWNRKRTKNIFSLISNDDSTRNFYY